MSLKLGWSLMAGGLVLACGMPATDAERPIDWRPSRISMPPASDLAARVEFGRSPPALGKYPLRFYQKLKAKPSIASLAEVDIWELRHHPQQYDVITIGPVSFRQYSGRAELLDQLAVTHGLTKEKVAVLINWVKTGGTLWSEFGVFIQGHEWIRSGGARQDPPLPDLEGFTILGLPTRSFAFEAERRGPFSIERKIYTFQNEARHESTADIKLLKLVQSDLRAVYPIAGAERGAPLIRERDNVYATVVPFGEGKVVSTLPFDPWDVETDGEKFRINLAEWLAGYPVPVFDPILEIERARD